jgi:bacterioferritin
MGKKGREMAAEHVNVEELVDALNKAYADEWIAFYYYWYAAQVAVGRGASAVANELKRIASDELEHAEELATRILQLGGTPIKDIGGLVESANCPTVDLPEDPSDLDGVVEAVIEGERCALEVYNKILKMIGAYYKEPTTFHLIRHIMDEEVGHEDTFENLLGE